MQNNHTKELNNLCNLFFGNEIKKSSNKQFGNNITNSIRQKKISILKKTNKEKNAGNDVIRKNKTNLYNNK